MSKKFIIISIVFIAAAFGAGWFFKPQPKTGTSCKSVPLRINSFKLVKPLLVCDTSSEKGKSITTSLQANLESIIEKAQKTNSVQDVSVYFQDFNTDARIDINDNIKFNPASINKIAIMIAVFKIIESNPSLLYQKIQYNGGDQNAGQEILPKDYLKKGQTYTLEEIIKKMIESSDNNSFYTLLSSMNHSDLESLYKDLQIPASLLNPSTPDDYDYETTKDASYFFRVLYNSTYLSPEMSEKALEMLSNTDFKDGIVAGLPKNVTTAHKFGLITMNTDTGKIIRRELHDCGVVYHPQNPYLLCIMTKSQADIPNIESVIESLSSAVWQFQDKR